MFLNRHNQTNTRFEFLVYITIFVCVSLSPFHLLVYNFKLEKSYCLFDLLLSAVNINNQ